MDSGWVLFDCQKQDPIAWALESNEVILTRLNNMSLIRLDNEPPIDLRYDHLAIEMIGAGGSMPDDSLYETAMWVGRFIQATLTFPEPHFTRIYRFEVLSHLGIANSGGSTDSAVRDKMIAMYGKDKTKGFKYDCWSALAIATVFSGTCGMIERLGQWRRSAS